jgi:hypothetical protein
MALSEADFTSLTSLSISASIQPMKEFAPPLPAADMAGPVIWKRP